VGEHIGCEVIDCCGDHRRGDDTHYLRVIWSAGATAAGSSGSGLFLPTGRLVNPLYLGEIVHILGIVVLSRTPVGLYLFVVALVLQIARAKIEERKFLRSLPEYAAYKKQTGFLWPRPRPA